MESHAERLERLYREELARLRAVHGPGADPWLLDWWATLAAMDRVRD